MKTLNQIARGIYFFEFTEIYSGHVLLWWNVLEYSCCGSHFIYPVAFIIAYIFMLNVQITAELSTIYLCGKIWRIREFEMRWQWQLLRLQLMAIQWCVTVYFICQQHDQVVQLMWYQIDPLPIVALPAKRYLRCNSTIAYRHQFSQ